MTLSRTAAVSKDVVSSFGRVQPEAPQNALGAVLLERIFGGADSLRQFESRLTPALRAELSSLTAEQNPEIFLTDLINFGFRLEQIEKHEEAARLLGSTLAYLETASEDFTALRSTAEKNYQALTGRGAFGPRTEVLLRRFCKEARDPASLAAMGVAAPLFRAGRLWTAARFQRASLIPEALSFGGGFFAETAGFTLTHKAVSSALGLPQDWTPTALSREWASGALVLGSLKVMSQASRAGLKGYMRAGNLPHFAQEHGLHSWAIRALPQIGMLGGVMLGHRLEEGFGLRTHSEAGAFFADSLATLLHLNVGGALVTRALGGNAWRAQAETELRLQNWRNRLPPAASMPYAADAVLASGPRFVKLDPNLLDPIQRPQPLLMQGERSTGTSSKPSIWTPEKSQKAVDFLRELTVESKLALAEIFQSAEGQLKMAYTLRQHTFSDKEIYNRALCRLGYAIKHAKSGKAEGSYVDWLLRTVFEEVVENLDGARADRILHFLAEGGTVRDFEAMLAKDLPDLRLNRFAAWMPQQWKAKNPHYAQIQLTPLPQELRNILYRWSYTQAQAKTGSPYFQTEGELLEALSSNPVVMVGQIRGVLETAARSPLGILRLKRMTEVLRDPDALYDFIDLKLQELADPNLTLTGLGQAALPHPLFRSPPSQFNGYLGKEAPEVLLNEIQKRLPDLLNPAHAALRAQRRKEHLKMLETQNGRLGRMEHPMLITAFQLLGDPYSKKIAKALQKNEFDLRVLPDREFESEVRRLSSRIEPEQSSAQFFPAGHGRVRGVMLVRERSFDFYSSEVAPDALFTVMGKIAHEYQHHLDMHPQLLDTPRNRLVIEMSAHLRDALWKAEHGEVGKLRNYTRDGSLGLALHFRNEFEQIYLGLLKKE